MTDQGSSVPLPPPPPPMPMHPQPPQMEIPRFSSPDVQLLIQDLAQSRRDLFEERKNSSNRIAEERERSRWEIERIRFEFGAQVKSLERENSALVRAVGRIQGENDVLREQNALFRLKPMPEPVAAAATVAPAPAGQMTAPPVPGLRSEVAGVPRGASSVAFMPNQGSHLGKPVPVPPAIAPSGPQIIKNL